MASRMDKYYDGSKQHWDTLYRVANSGCEVFEKLSMVEKKIKIKEKNI